MADGIRDKVAIIGMGCSRFGERWDMGAEELIVEAFTECIEDAGIDQKEIQAAWVGNCFEEVSLGKSALGAAMALRLDYVPFTRVENYWAVPEERDVPVTICYGPSISAQRLWELQPEGRVD